MSVTGRVLQSKKKEGKLKSNKDVVIMDLPGIYSLSPYTLEEVVARNYLITERPDAILNIIDGTNLEKKPLSYYSAYRTWYSCCYRYKYARCSREKGRCYQHSGTF